ncbi:hypothetical protein HNR27_002998 [Ornithinibacillus bavariensis]
MELKIHPFRVSKCISIPFYHITLVFVIYCRNKVNILGVLKGGVSNLVIGELKSRGLDITRVHSLPAELTPAHKSSSTELNPLHQAASLHTNP